MTPASTRSPTTELWRYGHNTTHHVILNINLCSNLSNYSTIIPGGSGLKLRIKIASACPVVKHLQPISRRFAPTAGLTSSEQAFPFRNSRSPMVSLAYALFAREIHLSIVRHWAFSSFMPESRKQRRCLLSILRFTLVLLLSAQSCSSADYGLHFSANQFELHHIVPGLVMPSTDVMKPESSPSGSSELSPMQIRSISSMRPFNVGEQYKAVKLNSN
jgi:hypothetical protein